MDEIRKITQVEYDRLTGIERAAARLAAAHEAREAFADKHAKNPLGALLELDAGARLQRELEQALAEYRKLAPKALPTVDELLAKAPEGVRGIVQVMREAGAKVTVVQADEGTAVLAIEQGEDNCGCVACALRRGVAADLLRGTPGVTSVEKITKAH